MALQAGVAGMGAVVLWVRSVLRRSRVATVSIVLLAGVSAGVVGSAFQAVRRAEGSIERHAARSASYDVIVNGCPPEVPDPYDVGGHLGAGDADARARHVAAAASR